MFHADGDIAHVLSILNSDFMVLSDAKRASIDWFFFTTLVSTNTAGVTAINRDTLHPCLLKNLNVVPCPCAGVTVHRRMRLIKLYEQQPGQELRGYQIPDHRILGPLNIHLEQVDGRIT
jgi:hypothetical protein